MSGIKLNYFYKRKLLIFVLHIFLTFVLTLPSEVPQVLNFLTDSCGEVSTEIANDTRAAVPWTAGIFTIIEPFPKASFKFLHTGAIVRANVIFTLLKASRDRSYFTYEDNKRLYINKLFVVAGVMGTDIKDFQKNTQIVEVDFAIAYENSPANLNYQLVLLHLKKPLDLRGPFVRSICVPFTSVNPTLLRVPLGNSFLASGFAYNADWGGVAQNYHRLFVQILTRGSKANCKNRFDELYDGSCEQLDCGWKNGRLVDSACLSRGSIDNFQYGGRYFLKGLSVLEKSCRTNSTIFFINLLSGDQKLQNWMLNTIKCMSLDKFSCTSGECIDGTNICNQKSDCKDASGLDENPSLCSRLNPCQGKESFYCGLGQSCISKNLTCNGRKDCSNGADELLPICKNSSTIIITKEQHNKTQDRITSSNRKQNVRSKCDLLEYPNGVALNCTRNDTAVNCEKEAYEGTKLKLSCKPFHIANSKISYIEMTCSENGTWTPFKPFTCEPDCGRIDINLKHHARPHKSNGLGTTSNYVVPWYAALFLWSEGKKAFEFACGASLIENSVIITAAHCVTNSRGDELEVKHFRVVLGPSSSNFTINSEQNGSRIVKVRRIWVPRTYDPYTSSSDIAVVRLNETVDYTRNIQPICYLTIVQTAKPSIGTVGLVTGFGKDVTGNVSKNLNWTGLPVISPQSCTETLGVNIEGFEFCAGYRNGTASCEGDGGSGLVVKKYNTTSDRSPYVLKGIVSRGLASEDGDCGPIGVGIFTHVDSFGAWILETLSNIDVF